MRDGARLEQGSSEVAFSLLRVLTMGYYLWGRESDLSLSELPPILDVTRSELAQAITSLWDLNLVLLDERRHTVRLSPQAIRQFLVDGRRLS
ncbi:MAG TPA: hypothetical protein VL403_10775 [Candidatus Kryptonia bacterium]|nr:hypothetical protein [Candidatus Kryptonia bacterium]